MAKRAVLPRSGSGTSAPRAPDLPGLIEAAVQLPSRDGWLLVGWTPIPWSTFEPGERLYAEHSFGTVTGDAHSVFHDRPDVAGQAVGFCTVLLGPTLQAAQLKTVELPAARLRLNASPESAAADAPTIATRVRRIAHRQPDGGRPPILDYLPRPQFNGADSLARLWPPVHLTLDQAVRVGSDGLALVGWLLDTGKSVIQIAVRGAGRRVVLDPAEWITIRRPDVLKDLAKQYGLDDDRIGFIAYAPAVAPIDDQTYIEIETDTGEFGFKPVKVFDRPALGVMKQFLSVRRPPPSKLASSFDRVLGPTIEGLAQQRRPLRPAHALSFGTPAAAPRASVVVTLYGRVDFMEVQLALFSERPSPATELIYVLDDPSLDDEAEQLAFTCEARFKIPFRLLILPENVGFAAANNVGLHHAKGRYVCLLNSDVFPLPGQGLTWIDRLTAHLERDASLGAVAPRLLYADGTVQHQGMHYEKRAEAANWWFPIHSEKGGVAAAAASLRRVPAISGACMVVRRQELLAYGGLDEGYVIGDFEDADLCQRLATDGKACAVDLGQALYHLERQSQGGEEAWRANATFYNAWRFNRRWGQQIDGRTG